MPSSRMLRPLFRNRAAFFPSSTRTPFLPLATRKHFFPTETKAQTYGIRAFTNRLLEANKGQPLISPKTAIVMRQHCFETVIDQTQAIKTLGAEPSQIYYLSKFYTQSPRVFEKLKQLGIHVFADKPPKTPGAYKELRDQTAANFWEHITHDLRNKDIDTIIIQDEGGLLLETCPPELLAKYKFAVVEQTSGGFYSEVNAATVLPRINVAHCYAKKELESDLIADSIIRALKNHHYALWKNHNIKCFAVVGNGSIGKEVVQSLLENFSDAKVYVYDDNEQAFDFIKDDPRCFRLNSVAAVIRHAQVILGCTGKDILADQEVFLESLPLPSPKIFVSCSSEDKEFYSYLKKARYQKRNDPLADAWYDNERHARLTFVNGGCPVNLRKEDYSVQSQNIALTRMLMIGATAQAALFADSPKQGGYILNHPSCYQPHPILQKMAVINHWKPTKEMAGRYPRERLAQFQDLDHIRQHSNGSLPVHPFFDELVKRYGENEQYNVLNAALTKNIMRDVPALFAGPFCQPNTPAPESTRIAQYTGC